jgi:hypothetical protein
VLESARAASAPTGRWSSRSTSSAARARASRRSASEDTARWRSR